MRTIAIVGRPNVGKSTLFNRLINKKLSIVDDISGVTRDRLIGESEWEGIRFNIIDTGGYVSKPKDIFEQEIRKQVEKTIADADLLLFMTDVTTGITDEDEHFARIIRKSGKNAFLLVNKVDNNLRENDAWEFYKLGIEPLFTLSSVHGSGTGDMLEEAVKVLRLEPEKTEKELDDVPRIAIVGRPNAGKSTLLNSLLDEERSLVTEIPGTTRDALHTSYTRFGKNLRLIDTAGLRKKSKVSDDIEYYSVIRTIKAIDECHVALLMIDAFAGVGVQDLRIMELIMERKKGMVVLVNKWDLIEKDTHTAISYAKMIREKTAPFTDFPIIFVSAQQKQRILKSLDTALEVYQTRKSEISVPKLNKALEEITARQSPPSVKGKFVKIKYVTRLKKSYPHLVFFCNYPALIKAPYKRFLENEFRKRFNFHGVPLTISFSEK